MSGGNPDIIAISDNQEESDQLLDELTAGLSDMVQYGTVYINVQYIGKHFEPFSLTWGDIAVDGGMLGASIVLSIIGGPICTVISGVGYAVSGYLISGDIGEILHPGLSGGVEYHQYKVTASWYEEHTYSGGSDISFNQYEFYYVRDTRIIDDPQWYMQAVIPVYP